MRMPACLALLTRLGNLELSANKLNALKHLDSMYPHVDQFHFELFQTDRRHDPYWMLKEIRGPNWLSDTITGWRIQCDARPHLTNNTASRNQCSSTIKWINRRRLIVIFCLLTDALHRMREAVRMELRGSCLSVLLLWMALLMLVMPTCISSANLNNSF